MKHHIRIPLGFVMLLALLMAACSTPTPEVVMKTVVVEKEGEKVVVIETKEVVVASTPAPAPIPGGANALPSVASRPNRMIIKNAEMQTTVEDTDVAIDLVTQVVGDTGGYIISSRVWFQDWLGVQYKYASVTLGVPVDNFELAMRRLRGLAITVNDERAAGQDVTDEYVDLDSRLGNLEATRDRIREFLDQATTVEESLRVNAELAIVEAEIETVKGRMNYLGDRSAYSTITIQLNPALPPAPTPEPTPTPTPTPTPEPWSASAVAADASHTLVSALQILAEVLIWFGIAVLPLALPVVGLIAGGRYLFKRLGLL